MNRPLRFRKPRTPFGKLCLFAIDLCAAAVEYPFRRWL